MIALVGQSGSVGNSICACGGIDRCFDSDNVKEAYGLKPDLLIYAGLGETWELNSLAPAAYIERIIQSEKDIWQIEPKHVVLISTIDVFRTTEGVDENTVVDITKLHPFGHNRYLLEEWTRDYDPEALIIRLPVPFGERVRGNFIFDMIDRIPGEVNPLKYKTMARKFKMLNQYYTEEERPELRETFRKLGFTAVDLNDSRSRFQFYPLSRLWDDIRIGLENDIRLWHAATEPVSTAEVYQAIYGEEFMNHVAGPPADYDCRTIYDALFGGRDGYICGKEDIIRQIKTFVEEQTALLAGTDGQKEKDGEKE